MTSPCVIARLFGGLGNQLFIYAFSRALAERNRVPLQLDITGGFERDPVYRRCFLLDRLIPSFVPAGRWESRVFPGGRTLRSLDRKLNRLLPLKRRYFIQECNFAFNADIYHFPIVRPTVFNGVWQSPRYFDDLNMHSLLQFPDRLIRPLSDEAGKIRDSNSVCLAIRRYEEVIKTGPHIVQPDYFNRAMARIEQHVDNPHYFVFAQDMDWARDHIRSRHPVTFAHQRDPYDGVIQDLYLMTQCRHYIISNSSLHWWAAWLGSGGEASVVTPAIGWPNSDLLINSWMQVQV